MMTWNVMLNNGQEFEVEADNWKEAFADAVRRQANNIAMDFANEEDFENNLFDIYQMTPDPRVVKALQELLPYTEGELLSSLRETFGFDKHNQLRRDF